MLVDQITYRQCKSVWENIWSRPGIHLKEMLANTSQENFPDKSRRRFQQGTNMNELFALCKYQRFLSWFDVRLGICRLFSIDCWRHPWTINDVFVGRWLWNIVVALPSDYSIQCGEAPPPSPPPPQKKIKKNANWISSDYVSRNLSSIAEVTFQQLLRLFPAKPGAIDAQSLPNNFPAICPFPSHMLSQKQTL